MGTVFLIPIPFLHPIPKSSTGGKADRNRTNKSDPFLGVILRFPPIARIMLSSVITLVQPFRVDVFPEDVPLEEIRDLSKSIRSVLACRDAEDVIEFFEGLAFGLGHEEEHQEEANDIPDGVPRKCALIFERCPHTRPGD